VYTYYIKINKLKGVIKMMNINTWKEIKELQIEASHYDTEDYFVVVDANIRTVWNRKTDEEITFQDVLDGNHRLAKSIEDEEEAEIWMISESLLMDNGFYGEEDEDQSEFQEFVRANGERYNGKFNIVTV